jgi:hypothetical protein
MYKHETKAFPGVSMKFLLSHANEFSRFSSRGGVCFLRDEFSPYGFSSIGIFSEIFHLRFTSGRQQTSFLFTTLEPFYRKPNADSHDPVFQPFSLANLQTRTEKLWKILSLADGVWKTVENFARAHIDCCWYFNDLTGVAKMRRISAAFFFSPLAARLPSAHRSHAGDRKTRKTLP